MAQAIQWPLSCRALQQQALMSGEGPPRLEPPLVCQACKVCSESPVWQSLRQDYQKWATELEDLNLCH